MSIVGIEADALERASAILFVGGERDRGGLGLWVTAVCGE